MSHAIHHTSQIQKTHHVIAVRPWCFVFIARLANHSGHLLSDILDGDPTVRDLSFRYWSILVMPLCCMRFPNSLQLSLRPGSVQHHTWAYKLKDNTLLVSL